MTFSDYMDRIMKATADTRLSDLMRMINDDKKLSAADRSKLQAASDRRMGYFASLRSAG